MPEQTQQQAETEQKTTPESEQKPPEGQAPPEQEKKPESVQADAQHEERVGAARAQLARERVELQAQLAEIEKAKKELEEVRSQRSRLEKFKEDPLLLLQEFGHKFEDVSKRALSAPPTDPRTLELKAEVENTKKELEALRQEAQAREVRKSVDEELGRIGAALDTEDYEQARAAGWTPERVWGEMEQVYRMTGKLPARRDVLDLIEKTELERLPKITGTKKAQAKLKPPEPQKDPKKPQPAQTINNQRSAPPAKDKKVLSPEKKIEAFLAEGKTVFSKG